MNSQAQRSNTDTVDQSKHPFVSFSKLHTLRLSYFPMQTDSTKWPNGVCSVKRKALMKHQVPITTFHLHAVHLLPFRFSRRYRVSGPASLFPNTSQLTRFEGGKLVRKAIYFQLGEATGCVRVVKHMLLHPGTRRGTRRQDTRVLIRRLLEHFLVWQPPDPPLVPTLNPIFAYRNVTGSFVSRAKANAARHSLFRPKLLLLLLPQHTKLDFQNVLESNKSLLGLF